MSAGNKKRSDIINLFLGLFIVVLLNVLSNFAFTRFDLTAEKRFTLSEGTRNMLDSLDDLVYFKVYLDGEFPQGAGDFKRLRDETRIMLDEFRAIGGNNVQYDFIDPNESKDPNENTKYHQQLESMGMIPQPINVNDDNGAEVQKLLFPWATVTYNKINVLIPLMGWSANPNENQLNHAVEDLEYELCNGIRKAMMKIKPRVAITQGHGEPDTSALSDLAKGLREYYEVDYVNFTGNLSAFRDTVQSSSQIRNKYDAIIIDKPDSAFTPKDLFILDQFVMYGGKAMFLVDPVYVNMDSLHLTGMTLGLPRQLGLEELLFRYGARLNSTLVEDYYSGSLAIPVPNQPGQLMKLPWVYSPTITPKEKHPIVKNLNPIKFDFVSTVDTVETSPGINKTILISSSDKSRFQRMPTRISLMYARIPRPMSSFDKPDQPVAVLLDGHFDSYFKNKYLPPELKNSPDIGYIDRGKNTKIIVVGDGDVALNPVNPQQPPLLGMDLLNRRNPEFYANKTFLLNCMNYLCDDKNLLSLRSREVTLRLLDHQKIIDHRLKWQMINTLVPILVIICMGFLRFWLRKRRYGTV